MVDGRKELTCGCLRKWLCVVVCFLPVVMATRKGGKLSVWIDDRQVETFIGYKMEIFVVKDGDVAPYIKQPGFADKLPSIPSQVDTVNLTWTAGHDMFTYWFDELRSLDNRVLFDPLLSIPASGRIPKKITVFQVAIPCTGHKKGVATLVIGLEIYDKYGQRIRGAPIKLRLKKQCKLHAGSQLCQGGCKNGGRCNRIGKCECRHSFYGKNCQIAMCFPTCRHNGTCISPGQCSCRDGYEGQFCETVLCVKPCENGGRCISRDLCWCAQGFYGDTCQYSQCKSPCQNEGSCIGKNKCLCASGFKGETCEIAFNCRKSCGEHGVCVEENVCRCKTGWRGRHCHKRKKSRGRRSHSKNKKRQPRKGNTRHGKRPRKVKRWMVTRKKRRRLLNAVRKFSERKERKERRRRRERVRNGRTDRKLKRGDRKRGERSRKRRHRTNYRKLLRIET